jgi:hypothetical protein
VFCIGRISRRPESQAGNFQQKVNLKSSKGMGHTCRDEGKGFALKEMDIQEIIDLLYPLVQKKELSVLAIDLNDIFESCYNYMRILSELAAATEYMSKETLIEKLIIWK